MKVTLSVIFPVWNGERFLRDSILRCFRDRIEGLEVIVVDDGSTDKTAASVADLPIRYFRLEKNSGQAAAQNAGLTRARGEYVTFLDCDDVLVPSALRWRLEWLREHASERVVAGEIAGIINERAELLGSYRSVLNPRYVSPCGPITREYLRTGGEFPSPVWLLLFRRDLLDQVGPFDETLRCAHDNDYFHRVIALTPIAFVARPVAFYRLHEKNQSGGWEDGRFVRNRMALAEDLFVHLKHGIPPR